MSRLDPKVEEENRVAFIRDNAKKSHDAVVATWLRANLDIGVLYRNGKWIYYRTVNGNTVMVPELGE